MKKINEEQRIEQLKKLVNEHGKPGSNDERQLPNKPTILQMADHQLESIRNYSNMENHQSQEFTELPKSTIQQDFNNPSTPSLDWQRSHILLGHPRQYDDYHGKLATYDTTTSALNPSSHNNEITTSQSNHQTEEEQSHRNTYDGKITSSTAALDQVENRDQDDNHHSNSYTHLERLVSQIMD